MAASDMQAGVAVLFSKVGDQEHLGSGSLARALRGQGFEGHISIINQSQCTRGTANKHAPMQGTEIAFPAMSV